MSGCLQMRVCVGKQSIDLSVLRLVVTPCIVVVENAAYYVVSVVLFYVSTDLCQQSRFMLTRNECLL